MVDEIGISRGMWPVPGPRAITSQSWKRMQTYLNLTATSLAVACNVQG